MQVIQCSVRGMPDTVFLGYGASHGVFFRMLGPFTEHSISCVVLLKMASTQLTVHCLCLSLLISYSCEDVNEHVLSVRTQ